MFLRHGGDQMVPGFQGTMEPMPASIMLLPAGDDQPSQQWDQGEIGHNLE